MCLCKPALGHLRFLLTDVPPQPNSPPDTVFDSDRPCKIILLHVVYMELFVYLFRPFLQLLFLLFHVCIYFHLSCYSTFKPNHTPRYNVYRADFDSMHAAFSTIDWPDIMEPMNTKEAWEFFKTVLQDIIDKYVPMSIGVQKKRNIYMSPEAFKLKKLKRKLWKTIPCLRLTMITKLLRKLEISLDVLHKI